MKTKAICSFFVLFAIVAGIGATTPAAFADHSEVTIEPVAGSGISGCEDTADGCYSPSTVTVDVGGKVIFSNTDVKSHTFTSFIDLSDDTTVGNEFNTGLLQTGEFLEWSPDTVGEIKYFCMIHPWMEGLIIVEAAAEEEMVMEEEVMEEPEVVEDIELMVTITDSVMDDGTHVYLEFSEIHVNYEITATQNGEQIFKEASHAMEMTSDHHIDAVGSDESPIVIEVVSLPGEGDIDWNGPTGIVATSQVVPEFGTIAMMILAVAIISIVAVTTKSRVIPRF